LDCGGATPLFLGQRKVLVVYTRARSCDAAVHRDVADIGGSAANQSGGTPPHSIGCAVLRVSVRPGGPSLRSSP
ncbi:MAG: hypothetical protein JXA69_11565, partial [Phycisphaerae bacterium]|nr:hypothetical protein [Phycisphaerae bacterium]